MNEECDLCIHPKIVTKMLPDSLTVEEYQRKLMIERMVSNDPVIALIDRFIEQSEQALINNKENSPQFEYLITVLKTAQEDLTNPNHSDTMIRIKTKKD